MLCNSWIIVSRAARKPVFETWNASVADAVNLDRYEVLTAHVWLVRFRKQVLDSLPR